MTMRQVDEAKKRMAFVLSGGGSRGALQVGALRAMFEAGMSPDLLVGTSIGAVNTIGLALWGVNLSGVDALELAWEKVSRAQLLDSRISKLIQQSMLKRPNNHTRRKIEDFFISMGITQDLTFADFENVEVGLISADILTGQIVIHGLDKSESVLTSLLSSIALPPWFNPMRNGSRLTVDGGLLSNLSIEPAIKMGATEIIAFDLNKSPDTLSENLDFTKYIDKYFYALNNRHAYLEMKLAEERGIPVHRIDFKDLTTDPIWNFSSYKALIEAGYEKTHKMIIDWNMTDQSIVVSS